MNPKERKKAARLFVERWQDKGSERAHSQSFWLDLLGNVYGIENPVEYISFENSFDNMMDSTSFLDGYIEKTSVLIEQDHRPVKRRNKFYRSLRTASTTIKGMEAIRGLYKKTRKEGTLFGFSVCTEIKVLLGIPA